MQGGVVTEFMRDLLCCRALLEVRTMRDVPAYRWAELLASSNRAPHLLQRRFANGSNITNNCKQEPFSSCPQRYDEHDTTSRDFDWTLPPGAARAASERRALHPASFSRLPPCCDVPLSLFAFPLSPAVVMTSPRRAPTLELPMQMRTPIAAQKMWMRTPIAAQKMWMRASISIPTRTRRCLMLTRW